MDDFQGWVTGNVATAVRHRVAATGLHVADFRIACTRRRRTKAGEQRETTSFLGVRCFGVLADNVASCVALGDAVVVVGRLEVEENTKDGQRYRDMVLLAVGVGPNLALGTTTFRRSVGSTRPAQAA